MLTLLSRRNETWMEPLNIRQDALRRAIWIAGYNQETQKWTNPRGGTYEGSLSPQAEPTRRAWGIHKELSGETWLNVYIYEGAKIRGLLAGMKYFFREEVIAVEFDTLDSYAATLWVAEGTRGAVIGRQGVRIETIRNRLGMRGLFPEEAALRWQQRISQESGAWTQELRPYLVLGERPHLIDDWGTPDLWKVSNSERTATPLFTHVERPSEWSIPAVEINAKGSVVRVQPDLLNSWQEAQKVSQLLKQFGWPEALFTQINDRFQEV